MQPRLVCFHGLMAYKAYLQYGEGEKAAPELGLQPRAIGESERLRSSQPQPGQRQVLRRGADSTGTTKLPTSFDDRRKPLPLEGEG